VLKVKKPNTTIAISDSFSFDDFAKQIAIEIVPALLSQPAGSSSAPAFVSQLAAELAKQLKDGSHSNIPDDFSSQLAAEIVEKLKSSSSNNSHDTSNSLPENIASQIADDIVSKLMGGLDLNKTSAGNLLAKHCDNVMANAGSKAEAMQLLFFDKGLKLPNVAKEADSLLEAQDLILNSLHGAEEEGGCLEPLGPRLIVGKPTKPGDQLGFFLHFAANNMSGEEDCLGSEDPAMRRGFPKLFARLGHHA